MRDDASGSKRECGRGCRGEVKEFGRVGVGEGIDGDREGMRKRPENWRCRSLKTYLPSARYSVTMQGCGGLVHAPMNKMILGCLHR